MGARAILVVENERLVALDLERRLARLGYAVISAGSGEEAIERASESRPDLILMDIKLDGDLDGIEVASRIQSSLDVPVVYLTAYAEESTLSRARNTEPYGFIVKPFEERELKATIEMALGRHQTDRQAREQAEIQRFLSDASVRLAESLNLREVLKRAAELLVPRHADWCLITLKETEAVPPFTLVHPDATREGPREPVEPGVLVARVLAASPVEVHPTSVTGPARVAKMLGWDHLARLEALRLSPEALICVPLVTRAQILGAMVLVSGRPERACGPSELAVVEDFAHRLAISIDNALLYREAKRAIRMQHEVLAMVSHDLRNALNPILLQAQLLRDKDKSGGLEDIVRAARGMSRLISDLLDSAAINAGRLSLAREPEAIAPLVAEVIESLRPSAEEKAISFRAGLPVEGAEVVCDRGRIQQVLSNLIGNAIKFSQRGATITVGVETRGLIVRFSVTDTGPGIPAEQVAHVFDRFWRSESRDAGTGLGLYIAKGIMEAHGSTLWAESEVGRGSTFFFMLTLASPEQAHAGSGSTTILE